MNRLVEEHFDRLDPTSLAEPSLYVNKPSSSSSRSSFVGALLSSPFAFSLSNPRRKGEVCIFFRIGVGKAPYCAAIWRNKLMYLSAEPASVRKRFGSESKSCALQQRNQYSSGDQSTNRTSRQWKARPLRQLATRKHWPPSWQSRQRRRASGTARRSRCWRTESRLILEHIDYTGRFRLSVRG